MPLFSPLNGAFVNNTEELTAPTGSATLLIVENVAAIAATGDYTVGTNFADEEEIEFNGVVFIAKETPEDETDFEIGTGATGDDTDLGISIDNLITLLNASVDPLISIATYSDNHTSTNKDATEVITTFDTPGATGNAFTLDTDTVNIVRSAATLEGGAEATEELKHIALEDLAAAIDGILNP